MKITNISDAGLFVNAKFATPNKLPSVAEYRERVAAGGFRLERCKVIEVAQMTCEEYDQFTRELLGDYEWLDGKGGANTEANLREVEKFWDYTEEEQSQWRALAYRLVVAVSAPRRATIYVDPSGFNYARYIGI